MWKHVLPPVAAVILIWLSISLATSAYISYSDHVKHRILSENVTSIIAASSTQVTCLRLLASNIERATSIDEFEATFNPFRTELVDSLAILQKSSTTEQGQRLFEEMRNEFSVMDSTVQTLRDQSAHDKPGFDPQQGARAVLAAAQGLSSYAAKMTQKNRDIIEDAEVEQKRLLNRVMLIRHITLLLGPAIGMVLGWRISAQLQKRVSTLDITLRSATAENVFDVGEYSLSDAKDLKDIQQLSENVINRMHQIGTDLKRAQQEVIQSERLAAVGELSAGIAHELRNPLTSIKLLLQHAAQGKDSGQISLANLNLVLNEIGRMEETIQGLLNFSRPASMTCRVHDIRIPLERAITLVSGRAASSHIAIVIEKADSPLFVNGDAEQLHLVFVNLLINALDSISSSGTIAIEATKSDLQKKVQLVFRDTGRGIPLDLLNRIFEPFVTTKERGTGLGLALCHRIVTSHKGTITAENQAVGGAVFRLELPIAENSSGISSLN
jgi:two-component system, NtrC family, sensor histidine kinase HydH